ncbi:GGDEF domain-containing protein [Cyanothece sp. BG0011]|uniref:GGDEF domain-containing protein n=1 Tax=Cyanothece sp. BG0011 TaxID=2082950 RepID=UPI000D1F4D77|nr:GGDEF domain-containing protein [Cyanothece sp. BG0011]
MKIKELIEIKLEKLYQSESADILTRMGELLEPEISAIVSQFYTELLEIPETEAFIKHSLVDKNLKQHLTHWIKALFNPHNEAEIKAMIKRQKRVGLVHANINVNFNYFTYGISILKREIYSRLHEFLKTEEDITQAFLVLGQVFDILVSIISEAYVSNEVIHETNELSLKMKGISPNTAIECERLRGLLLDWLRNTLTFLYQNPDIHLDSLPKLQSSNFGLWVVYKADFIGYQLDFASDLKQQILDIDHALFIAAKSKIEGKENQFFDNIVALNDAVTKTSWFISSLIEKVLELDTGMDALTRVFNRRYLPTILRRQTEICRQQKLPYAMLAIDIDHFKQINDTYQHKAGDLVLKQFAELLLGTVRESDFIFRSGGEEFLVLLGSADQYIALHIAERIRHKCEIQTFKINGVKSLNITCSIGVAIYEGHPDYNRILQEADSALYKAKDQGRNCVVFK